MSLAQETQAVLCYSFSQHFPAHPSSNLLSHQGRHTGTETHSAFTWVHFHIRSKKQDHSSEKIKLFCGKTRSWKWIITRVFFPCRDEELVPDCLWRSPVASILTGLHVYSVILILSVISNSKTNVVDILCIRNLNLSLF